MTTILITFFAPLLVLGFMMASLRFARYRQGRSCCNSGTCSRNRQKRKVACEKIHVVDKL